MTIQKSLWLGFIAFLFFSCNKDSETFVPDTDVDIPIAGDIDHFFAALEEDLPTEIYQVPGEWGSQIITPRKTVITIPGNAFVDVEGNMVKGNVELRILELYSRAELVMFGRQTVSDGQLLESAGEFYIEAFKDGEPVTLAEGSRIQIQVPNANPASRMELFYGEGADNQGQGRETFNWIQADGDPDAWDNVFISEWVVQDTTGGGFGFGYECFSDSLKWINLDIFNDIPEEDRTDVCVELPAGFGNTNTVVYLVFNDLNAFIVLQGNPETMQWCNYYTEFMTIGVPIGADVTFIAISEQGEDCYFLGTNTTTVSADHLEILDPVKTPLEDIKDFLMGL